MGVGFGALSNPICVGVWDLLQECPIAARLPVASMGDIVSYDKKLSRGSYKG